MFFTEDAALATWPHWPLPFAPRNLAEELEVFWRFVGTIYFTVTGVLARLVPVLDGNSYPHGFTCLEKAIFRMQ
jgi:hypothetical protein